MAKAAGWVCPDCMRGDCDSCKDRRCACCGEGPIRPR